jgi:hypothetical protein
VSGSVVLNEYHIQFLHHLARHKVTFLIVRGQARWLINKEHRTRDLDIWVSIVDKCKPTLERALIEWAREHPLHTNQNWTPPLPLRPNVQIAFPEFDGVWYTDRSGEPREISTADRVDVLTSLQGMPFKQCFKQAVVYDVEGVPVRAMSAADLDQAAKFRFDSEGRF